MGSSLLPYSGRAPGEALGAATAARVSCYIALGVCAVFFLCEFCLVKVCGHGPPRETFYRFIVTDRDVAALMMSIGVVSLFGVASAGVAIVRPGRSLGLAVLGLAINTAFVCVVFRYLTM